MNDKSLIVIGEALIDFIPDSQGCALKDVPSFTKAAGGAPANVAGTVAKLGGKAKILTKLGQDAFGDYLIDCMNSAGIDTSYLRQDPSHETSLAFVSLTNDGNREFMFYRKNAADLYYNCDDIDPACLNDADIIHFCSVDLVESKMKQAHLKLIELAKMNHCLISFDPNLRFPLWDDLNALKQTVQSFLPLANIIKISEEELEFITGTNDPVVASKALLNEVTQVFIYTKGSQGCELFTNDFHVACDALPIQAVDTTGAGDSFIGAFIYKLLNQTDYSLRHISESTYQAMLDFASLVSAYVCCQKGALTALPSMNQLKQFSETRANH